jgi:hypothetical protein
MRLRTIGTLVRDNGRPHLNREQHPHMKNELPKPSAKRSTKERIVSPRVDGKRPRLKPAALDQEEHVRLEEALITPPGPEGTAANATDLAREETKKDGELPLPG